MATITAIGDRIAGPSFRTKALHFGRRWNTSYWPYDNLEFSEYGRGSRFHGWWVLGASALFWIGFFWLI
jgi:hypothetical protein